jgi:hypothetical protein
MVKKKRLKHHKQRAMQRRLKTGKTPMSKEQKEERKKARELQRTEVEKAREAKVKK